MHIRLLDALVFALALPFIPHVVLAWFLSMESQRRKIRRSNAFEAPFDFRPD